MEFSFFSEKKILPARSKIFCPNKCDCMCLSWSTFRSPPSIKPWPQLSWSRKAKQPRKQQRQQLKKMKKSHPSVSFLLLSLFLLGRLRWFFWSQSQLVLLEKKLQGNCSFIIRQSENDDSVLKFLFLLCKFYWTLLIVTLQPNYYMYPMAIIIPRAINGGGLSRRG